MCKWGTEAMIEIRDWRQPGGPVRSIPVDACIAHVVLALNRQGMRTVNCCCGHGRLAPSILVEPECGAGIVEICLEEGGSCSVRKHETFRYLISERSPQ